MNISRKKREERQHVRILIIDEISFFTQIQKKLDRYLKNIRGIDIQPFGGINIVFLGSFYEVRPVKCKRHGVSYEGVVNGLFEGQMNSAIVLDTSHRFDGDPAYGE